MKYCQALEETHRRIFEIMSKEVARVKFCKRCKQNYKKALTKVFMKSLRVQPGTLVLEDGGYDACEVPTGLQFRCGPESTP